MVKNALLSSLARKRAYATCLVVSSFFYSPFGWSDLIFQENFDDLQDFTSTMYTTTGAQRTSDGSILPQGWDALYNGTQWSPETGYPDNHASLEILSRNADKAYGGTGKSAVMWRESFSKGWKNWASDSQFMKYLDKGYDELYVEFYIQFSDNFYGRDDESNYTSKIFRIGSWSGQGSEFNGAAGDLGPVVIWDYKRDQYGVRNVLSFRGGPHGENYKFNGEHTADVSLNFTSNLKGQGEGGRDSSLLGLVSGSKLADLDTSNLDHEEVFGKPGSWTKMGFYVQMNSSPGARDGVFRQWVNGHQVLNKTDIPWVMGNSDNKMVQWNYFAIGGNDYFQAFDNELRHEDWYSIDNLKVYSEIPEEIDDMEPGSVAPNPPANIVVE